MLIYLSYCLAESVIMLESVLRAKLIEDVGFRPGDLSSDCHLFREFTGIYLAISAQDQIFSFLW